MLSLKDGQVVRQWSVLLPNCNGEAPGLLAAIEVNLGSQGVPGLSWKQESASTGFFKALAGKRRDLLVVRNEKFPEWLVCIGAVDYGKFLSVTWYLTTTPKFLNRVRSAAAGDVLVDGLDLFDQADVEAFIGVTRIAVVTETRELAKKHQLDLDRLERQARGIPAAV